MLNPKKYTKQGWDGTDCIDLTTVPLQALFTRGIFL